MKIDEDRIDDTVLALLWLGRVDEWRTWKGFDWTTLDRLFEKGLIDNPKSKRKSVYFTEEGLQRSEQLFKQMFVVDDDTP